MKRLANWEYLLAGEIARSLKRRFDWGIFDCALAAANFVYAQTGVDPGSAYRGKYSTEAEATAITGGDFAAFAAQVAEAAGMEEIPRLHARRGDLLLVDNGTAHRPSVALAIVDLSGQFALCAGPRALMRVKMHRWKRAWRV